MLIVIGTPLEAEVAALCQAAPVHQLRAVTNLLQAHADGRHIVVAPPAICRIWENCGRLSEEHRAVAKKVRGRYSELAELQNILPIYGLVTGGTGGPVFQAGIWNIPFNWIAAHGLSATQLICEDLYDCDVTREAARDYLSVKALARLNLALENAAGGGGNTHRVLADKAIQNQRICICVVDSDREEPSTAAAMGATATNCLAVTGPGLYGLCVTQGRELENHIPIRLLNKVRATWHAKTPSDTHATFHAISPEIPLFADFKSGLKRKDVETLSAAVQAFWTPLKTALSSTACCSAACQAATPGDCKDVLIAPLGRTLLRDVRDFLLASADDPRRCREYLPSPNEGFWLKVGEVVAAYGVSVKVAVQ
jgi:hypothetical protein